MSLHRKAIPDKSTVLIIGASSFIGAHITHAFLKFGYRVRAVDYNASKAAWLVEDIFKSDAVAGTLELAIVPDILADKAFEEVIKGVSAVIYVANFEVKSNPNETIPQNTAGILNALRTAAREPSVLRFVMTSSYSASFNPSTDANALLNATSWNESAVKSAWAPPPYEPSRYTTVYMASKVQQEQSLWRFVREEKPSFTVNTVIPSWVTGKVFSKSQNPSSTLCLTGLYNGDTTFSSGSRICKYCFVPTSSNLIWLTKDCGIDSFVSVRDVATLHVASAIDLDVSNERIYAIAQHSDWNDILSILRRIYPERKFIEDRIGLPRFQGQVDTSLGLGLLRKWGGQNGWTTMEDAIKDTLGDI
jgi:nucleoside-diphosphate-sugar epimerase